MTAAVGGYLHILSFCIVHILDFTHVDLYITYTRSIISNANIVFIVLFMSVVEISSPISAVFKQSMSPAVQSKEQRNSTPK